MSTAAGAGTTGAGDSTAPAAGRAPGPVVALWEDADLRESLCLVADALTHLAGFGIAAVSLVDGEELVVAAVSGTIRLQRVDGTEGAAEEMLGYRWPVAEHRRYVDLADDWGRFRFVPQERIPEGFVTGWVPDLEQRTGEDAWRPLDILTAPVQDESGALVGCITLDGPRDGLRPPPSRRRLLDAYAAQVERTVIDAQRRRALAARAALLESARSVVRTATRQRSLDSTLAEAAADLRRAFGLTGIQAELFAEDGSPFVVLSHTDVDFDAGPDLHRVARRGAARLWREQRVGVVGLDSLRGVALGVVAPLRAALRAHGHGSVMLIPLGAGEECYGHLLFFRPPDAPAWTDAECDAARDIGYDLGRSLLTARTLQHERELVRGLQELDEYKSRLITEATHRLDQPLSELVVQVDQVADSSASSPGLARRALRTGQQLTRTLDDLLLLARLADPEQPALRHRTDLSAVVAKAVAYARETLGERDLVIRARLPEEPVELLGSAEELERAVFALVSNAVRFTEDGGLVTVRLAVLDEAPEIELSVTDTGIGIAEHDLPFVLREFYRSADPRVQERPGAGLGLTVVDRIVQRHRGRIRVEQADGGGTRVVVTLPGEAPGQG